MATKPTQADCICERTKPPGNGGPWGDIIYNPRCPWHKGPDRGYGYDIWGQPNSKHSEAIGAWVTGILVGGCAIAIVAVSLWLVFKL